MIKHKFNLIITGLLLASTLTGCKSSILKVKDLQQFEMARPQSDIHQLEIPKPYQSVEVIQRSLPYYIDFYSLQIGRNSGSVYGSKWQGDSRLGSAGMSRSSYVRPAGAASTTIVFMVIYDDDRRLLYMGPQEQLLESPFPLVRQVTEAAIAASVSKSS